VLGRIAVATFNARHSGEWQRLKACSRDECQWVFYDQSRSQTSRWCSMRVCGNREKVRNYQTRNRQTP
jgi:predicted RNA-binding Zn ribbon-like protein